MGDLPFGSGIPFPLHISGIAQKRQNSLVSQRSQPGQVRDAAGDRRGIDLKVSCHNDSSHRSVDGERNRVGNGVVHVDKLHLKAPRFHGVPGLMGEDRGGFQQTVLLQLDLDQAGGQSGGMQRSIDLLEHIGYAADVVLMAVGEEESAESMLVLDQIGHIRDHQIHPVHIILRESETAVHHDHVVAVFQYGDVFSDLIETA